jgi:hypothetical protein
LDRRLGGPQRLQEKSFAPAGDDDDIIIITNIIKVIITNIIKV